ncbi:MAG TPA: Ku protein [Pseudomonadales bacterium]
MAARAMWKGVLRVGDASVPVKLYSAIEDRDIHFRLLHAADLVPVTQAMVNPRTDEVVPHDQTQRGYPAPDGGLVIVHADELAELTPKESRDIEFTRFVPIGAIDPQWYDRPYYLGPDEDNGSYAALTAALGRSKVEGVAHWVMRKKSYVGALRVYDGVLVLVSLRREGEVVAVDSLETISGPALDAKELVMAQQLMGMLEEDFDPTAYRDAYREQVLALVDAKAKGKKTKLKLVKPKPRTDDLKAALAASIGARGKEKIRATA